MEANCSVLLYSPKSFTDTRLAMFKIRQHLQSVVTFLDPLLPLANCHMVEFLTQNHWDKLIPGNLKTGLQCMDLNEAVDQFWKMAENCDRNGSYLLRMVLFYANMHEVKGAVIIRRNTNIIGRYFRVEFSFSTCFFIP